MNRHLLRRKALAWLLTLAMLFSFTGGLGVSPGTVEAQDVNGDFLLNVGNYRGLNQGPWIPVSVRNADQLVALEFTVVSSNNYNIDVSVESVVRGADLPGAATITWSGVGHGNVKIGIFMHEAGFNGDGELVRIRFRHDATEQTYNQPIALVVDPLSVTAKVTDGNVGGDQIFGDNSIDLGITSSSISNGEIRVAIMFGDMDKNESVTVNDALLALRASVGDLELTPQLRDAGDVKRAPDANAATVTIYDALLIAKKAVGLIDFFPVSPDPDAGLTPGEQTMFTIQPSGIFIGNHELTDKKTIIGGEVTFTVRFPSRIVGDVKIEVSGAASTTSNSEFINGTEVDITLDVSDQTGGLGERVVSAFQYNTITREKGVKLDRFVKVLDEAGPRDLFLDNTRSRQLDFSWNATNAASSIAIRQSIDGSAWTNARTMSPILSTGTTATVTGLSPERGYYFKLKVNGGVHDGQSDIIRFNRMTGNTIAERLGGDLHVIVLYTGEIKNLNPNRFASFEMVDANGVVLRTASSISSYQSRGIRVIFPGSSEENFMLRYTGPIDSLDRDPFSYVLSQDEVGVGEYGVVTEISVTTPEELTAALANTSVDRIAIGGNITLANATVDRPGLEIDGDDFTLTGNINVTADNARINNLTIDGNLDVTGDNFVGRSLTVKGTATINGEDVAFNTTFEGPVDVQGGSVTFTNVTFASTIAIAAGADASLSNCTIRGNVTLNEDATFTNTVVADNATISIANGKELTLNGNMTISNRTLTFDAVSGIAKVKGNATITGTTGKVVFGTPGSIVNAEGLTFEVDINVNETADFTDVVLSEDLTVTVASTKILTFDGDLETVDRKTVTFDGAGTVEFDIADLSLGDVVFTVATVLIADDATFTGSTFNSNVTVSVATTNTLILTGNISVASGRTLTLDGLGTVKMNAATLSPGNIVFAGADIEVAGNNTIGGNVTLTAPTTVTGTGTLSIAQGRTLNLGGNLLTLNAANTLVGAGTGATINATAASSRITIGAAATINRFTITTAATTNQNLITVAANSGAVTLSNLTVNNNVGNANSILEIAGAAPNTSVVTLSNSTFTQGHTITAVNVGQAARLNLTNNTFTAGRTSITFAHAGSLAGTMTGNTINVASTESGVDATAVTTSDATAYAIASAFTPAQFNLADNNAATIAVKGPGSSHNIQAGLTGVYDAANPTAGDHGVHFTGGPATITGATISKLYVIRVATGTNPGAPEVGQPVAGSTANGAYNITGYTEYTPATLPAAPGVAITRASAAATDNLQLIYVDSNNRVIAAWLITSVSSLVP